MIPIDIVNKILDYVSDLNQDLLITQYNPLTNIEYYKINFNHNFLWKLNGVISMKLYYPIRQQFANNKNNYEMYKCGVQYYEKKTKENNWKLIKKIV